MNDVELRTLQIMRMVWAVLAGEAPAEPVELELNRLERVSPDLFEQVVGQLERDNGRWSKHSQMPKVEIARNEKGLVESITFKNGEDSNNQDKDPPLLIWLSDRDGKKWLEAFTQELLQGVSENKAGQNVRKDNSGES